MDKPDFKQNLKTNYNNYNGKNFIEEELGPNEI